MKFPSLDPKDETGFDDWVESFEDLEAYFKEASWKVSWLEEKDHDCGGSDGTNLLS